MAESRIPSKDEVISACRKLGAHVVDGGEENGRGFVLLNCSHAFEDLVNALLPLVPKDVRSRILSGGPSVTESPDGSWGFEIHVGQDGDDAPFVSYVYVEIPLLSDLEAIMAAAGRLVSVPDVIN